MCRRRGKCRYKKWYESNRGGGAIVIVGAGAGTGVEAGGGMNPHSSVAHK